MLEMPFYTAHAQQTLRDLKDVFEEVASFGPVLFLYEAPLELRVGDRAPMRLASLGSFDQQEWPKVIRGMVERAGASMWGLATEVSIRVHQASMPGTVTRTEDWLVYLLCCQGGLLVWGAPVMSGRRLGAVRELTDDPRLQKMLAHLSEAAIGEVN